MFSDWDVLDSLLVELLFEGKGCWILGDVNDEVGGLDEIEFSAGVLEKEGFEFFESVISSTEFVVKFLVNVSL